MLRPRILTSLTWPGRWDIWKYSTCTIAVLSIWRLPVRSDSLFSVRIRVLTYAFDERDFKMFRKSYLFMVSTYSVFYHSHVWSGHCPFLHCLPLLSPYPFVFHNLSPCARVIWHPTVSSLSKSPSLSLFCSSRSHCMRYFSINMQNLHISLARDESVWFVG